jgi:hypothetical protein
MICDFRTVQVDVCPKSFYLYHFVGGTRTPAEARISDTDRGERYSPVVQFCLRVQVCLSWQAE